VTLLDGHNHRGQVSPSPAFRGVNADNDLLAEYHSTARDQFTRASANRPQSWPCVRGLRQDVAMIHPVPPDLVPLLEAPPSRQSSFGWSRGAWASQLHDLRDVVDALSALEDRVDRYTTAAFVLAELRNERVLSAFTAAMIWGYGPTGYGPSRLRWVLTGVRGRRSRDAEVRADVADRLLDAVSMVRERGPVEAYSHMYGAGRIKYLGGAFFTKWLYFASALDGPDTAAAAPILDKRVAVWLNANTDLRLRVDRTTSYRQYFHVLGDWASHFGRTRPQVEQAIFELTRQ
jgi:hypothetical protein